MDVPPKRSGVWFWLGMVVLGAGLMAAGFFAVRNGWIKL